MYLIGRRGFPIDNLVCEFTCLNEDFTIATNGNALVSSQTHTDILDKVHDIYVSGMSV